ncbi:ThiF family adenylyltransferase [bacterium]|nr:ThiF family adenylyltransferase [bacterium]
MKNIYFKFKNNQLKYLRETLLKNLSKEHFAILLGKREYLDNNEFIMLYDIRFPDIDFYKKQSIAFLEIKKEFIYNILLEILERLDVDTIVDIHTHPFAEKNVKFSLTDNMDESGFFNFLNDNFPKISYGSIVFSQSDYSARLWQKDEFNCVDYKLGKIVTQTLGENIISSDFKESEFSENFRIDEKNMFHRSSLVLGLDKLRDIMKKEIVSVVGVGGLGSVVAEHLIHMGFQNIHLIDDDILEISNLNRVVGAYYVDAEDNRYKVDIIGEHIKSINPDAEIFTHKNSIFDSEIESILANSSWIIVATDNHSSRFKAQEISIKYFVPMITIGVNITVNNGVIEDMSGEVITLRAGDNICLHCLNRLNYIQIGKELHFDKDISEKLERRGYVVGADIKEPAVKTLNTMLATIGIDILINQYTNQHKHFPILVYEYNSVMRIYPDIESIENRNIDCCVCNI